MTIDWLKFLPALVLLLTPSDLFNGDKVRYRDVTRDWDGFRLRVLAHGLHTIDLARAALGTWLLLDSLHGDVNAHGLEKYGVLLVQAGVQLLGVLLQTVVCRKEDAVNAPFMFVTGLLLGGSTPVVALFAIALALISALGAHAPTAYFPVLAFAQLLVGFWFKGKGAILVLSVSAIAAALPFLWAIMFRREMLIAYRAKRQGVEPPSPLR